MRPVAFGEALPVATHLTLFSDDKPDRSFTVIKFWMDATSGVALELKAVPAVNQGNRLVKHRLDSVAAGSRRS
jgi:hypothetical protein